MKQLLLISLCLASSVANAECYMRSTVKLTVSQITLTVDPQHLVVPDARGKKCVVRYRVAYPDKWETVEGEAVAKTESDACAQAANVKNGYILEDVRPSKLTADNQMVCSDLPDIRVRPVQRGETVWESEVNLHNNPMERKYFYYKDTKCRMFVERDARDQNMYMYQGIICKKDSTPNSKWLVLDKY